MPSKLSSKPQVLRRLFLPLFVTLGCSGCATTTPPPLQIPVPASLRAACEHPAPDAVQTIGQLAAFSLRQDAALDICDARRSALVAIIDGVNPKPAKKKLFGLF